jgi:putative spermidine/putrescine transport system permease protein
MNKNAIPIGLFLMFSVLPLAAGLLYALCYSLGWVGTLNTGFTLTYWSATLRDGDLWSSLGLSAFIALCSTALSVGLGLVLVLGCKDVLQRRIPNYLLYTPLAMPPIIFSFWVFQLMGSSGLLARWLIKTGWVRSIDTFPALINDRAHIGVMVALVLSTFPVFTLLFLNYYQSENIVGYSQLAHTLGATKRQTQTSIILPLLLRKAKPTILLYAIFLFGVFEVPLLLGRQSPRMISMLIHANFNKFNLMDLPRAYVITVIYAVIILSIVWMLFRKK